uniref:Bm89 n=1 Tax=Brugia malayi TaxID=6279 RepID=A0A1I9GBV9_BRUMA|nr:Bm89 [Brugia malayi]
MEIVEKCYDFKIEREWMSVREKEREREREGEGEGGKKVALTTF